MIFFIIFEVKNGFKKIYTFNSRLSKKRDYRIRKLEDSKIMEGMTKTAVVLAHYLGGKKTYLEMVSKAS
jgi:hypothetical protein